MNKSLQDIVLELIELFGPHVESIDSVLDIGTGTSILIHVFADKFLNVRFCTVDVINIRKRKKLSFITYDGKNLPFGNSEFDVSILNETLHHCKYPESVLRDA